MLFLSLMKAIRSQRWPAYFLPARVYFRNGFDTPLLHSRGDEPRGHASRLLVELFTPRVVRTARRRRSACVS